MTCRGTSDIKIVLTASLMASGKALPQFTLRVCLGTHDRASLRVMRRDGCGIEEGCGGGQGGFEVLCEPPVASEPSEQAFDDPSPGMDREADLIGLLLDDLDCNTRGGRNTLARIARVGEDSLDEGKRAA